ncbi:hypothetical protein RI543_001593 [Arxiozyma heterogenica]|uniref:Protein kinase domain-containing protein n=1 Tax=Arxiozyma heterogenica TaxID=278026 RepID=A0AAN8A929_9SACH|nr:hypothetical protein RI543_001593 [Kazachstania heterogenica]
MVKRSYEEDIENDIELINVENCDFHTDQNGNKRANKFTILKVPYTNGRYYYRNGQLSRGSHSIVYKLFNENETKIFAGKQLLTKGSKMLRRKIIDELELYKLICRQKQVNIVQLIEYFQTCTTDNKNNNENNNKDLKHDDIYMVLEYANNGTLQSILQYRGNLDEIETKNIILQICGGVFWLHRNNTVHGDLKLGNLLVDRVRRSIANSKHEYDIIKICDFGHSFINDQSKNYFDDQSEILGTPYYLAPELVCKYKGVNISGKTIPLISFPIDIWAIGVILFTMLYNRNLFISDKEELHRLSRVDLYSRITSNILRIPSDGPNITKECKNLLIKLLKQHPLKRLTLLEVIDHKWFKNGFIKEINLLAPNGGELKNRKRNNQNDNEIKEYIDALYKYGFDSLLNGYKNVRDGGDKKSIKDDILKNLKINVKREHKRRISMYNNISNHNNNNSIGTVLKENKVQRDISKRIIVDEIYVTLHNLYKTESNENREEKNKNSNKEEGTRSLILIKKCEERSYGDDDTTFLYEMTNGQVGCLFLDDEHSILLNDMKSTFWYIIPDKQNGWVSKCFKQEIDIDTDAIKIPNELNKRLQYVKDCKLDMDLNLNMDMNMDMNIDMNINCNDNVDTFIRKYTIYGDKREVNEEKISLKLYILSDNGTYQFNFEEERIIIVIQNFGEIITMIDYENRITITDTYYNILLNNLKNEENKNSNLMNMKKRLYDKMFIIKDVLKREMINNIK